MKAISNSMMRKTKKASSKKKTNKEDLSDVGVSAPEKIIINQLFKEAFLRHYKTQNENNKVKEKELTHLSLMCEEYLSTYALVGYSLQDEKVVIFNTPSQKDEAALVDLLRATFFQVVQSRP